MSVGAEPRLMTQIQDLGSQTWNQVKRQQRPDDDVPLASSKSHLTKFGQEVFQGK
jgi:hypothetical protein